MIMHEYTPTAISDEREQKTTADPIASNEGLEPSPQRSLFSNDKADASYGAIMAILSSPQYLALAGFIIIAAMGHITDWKTWALYVSFLIIISLYTSVKIFVEKSIDLFKKGIGWKSFKPLFIFFLLGSFFGMATASINPSFSSSLHDRGADLIQRVFSVEKKDSTINSTEPK